MFLSRFLHQTHALRSINPVVSSISKRGLTAHGYHDPKGERFSMTKIVGTIGPVSENFETTQAVANEGLRIMRINFSHATFEEATLRINNLRKSRGVHSHHGRAFNLRSVLLDTQGPEIRCGSFPEKKIELSQGKEIILTTDEQYRESSSHEKLFISYNRLPSTVKQGDSILLDDGLIRLTVLDTSNNEVRCIVNNTERLGSRKGVNLPGLVVDLPALTEKDKVDIEFGIKNDIDFIAASFVRKPEDVRSIRAFVDSTMKKYWPENHPQPLIISKIENHEGVSNFDEILEESDGIMVARGDLGVEIPIPQVFSAQKVMVDKCNYFGKPVIVATQMLESMIRNPRPTRAEVSDVGNAVLDGADAVMLSGEVAQGDYPVESVRTMMSIIKEADSIVESTEHFVKCEEPTNDIESIASSAVKTAHELDAKLIIVLTDTGYTARMVAKNHPNVPVMCFAASRKVGRQLQIHRALYPVVNNNADVRPTTEEAILNAKEMGWLEKGDKVVLLSAEELSDHLGTQIMLRVAHVQ